MNADDFNQEVTIDGGALKQGIKPDPRLRFTFPRVLSSEVPNALLLTGCMVAMQETGRDGYIYRDGELSRVLEAASVTITVAKGK